MSYEENLADSIKRLHGCSAAFLRHERVTEKFRGQTAWDGVVSIFDLQGHATAKQCYAWAYEESPGQWQYVAILHAPPVDSPLKAIQAFIIAESDKKRF